MLRDAVCNKEYVVKHLGGPSTKPLAILLINVISKVITLSLNV